MDKPGKHWALEYIGKPWAIGQAGPDAFDCWGLLYNRYERLGVKLPRWCLDPESWSLRSFGEEFKKPENRAGWIQISKPEENCAVVMSRFVVFTHVGIYTESDGGLVIHSQMRHGVCAHNILTLKRDGFRHLLFYKYQPQA